MYVDVFARLCVAGSKRERRDLRQKNNRPLLG